MGQVYALKIPVEPEFGGGDGDGAYQYICPECGQEDLHAFDDGAVVCKECGAVLSLRIEEEE